MKQPGTVCMYSKPIEIIGKELNNFKVLGGGTVSTEVLKSRLLLPKTGECFRFYTVLKASFSSLDFSCCLSLEALISFKSKIFLYDLP